MNLGAHFLQLLSIGVGAGKAPHLLLRRCRFDYPPAETAKRMTVLAMAPKFLALVFSAAGF
jgi:hypothetical protein